MGRVSDYFKGTLIKKPREKAREIGIENLEDFELLALIFETSTKGDNVLTLSKRYLDEKGGLKGIFLSDETNLKSYGVKDAKVYRLLAIKEIMRRLPLTEGIKIESPSDAFEKTKNLFFGLKDELLTVFFLTKNRCVLRREDFQSFNKNTILFPVNEILKKAIMTNADLVLMLHNHPSNSLNPSTNDINATSHIYKKLMECQILLLDSIIVNEQNYFSFREQKISPFY